MSASAPARALAVVLAAAATVIAPASAPAAGAQQSTSDTIAAGAPSAYAIRNVTIVPVVGPRIAGGTVVIRGGRIETVGADVAVPADATAIDGTGLFAYPGMIDSGTQLGLTEIGSVAGTLDTRELGSFNPQNRSLTAVNPHSELIPVTRVNGVTTAITAASGGLVSGYAALVDLAGWTPEEMAVPGRAAAAMVMTFPRMAPVRSFFGPQQPESEQREAVQRQTRELRTYLSDAKAYADVAARLAASGAARQRLNPAMEAMVPVMRGEVPVLFDVETADQIRGALALADSFGLRVILRGAAEAWRVADTLAARKIPVIVGPTTRAPGTEDPYDAIYANPGVLARAGVTIAFQSDDASNARNLPYNAALATAYGLDPTEALRALTINPARIWGVADRYGSIEPGKVANVIVTTGDPLDVRSVVRHLFVRGELVPLTDRHTRLYEQFRGRPRDQ